MQKLLGCLIVLIAVTSLASCSGRNVRTVNKLDLCQAYYDRKHSIIAVRSQVNLIKAEIMRREPQLKTDFGLIDNGRIRVGMSVCGLLAARGLPWTINESSYGPDQYVYRSGRPHYIYIDQGKVDGWN